MQPTPLGVSPGFPEATTLNAGIKEALRRSPPPRLVVLSAVGSEQASGRGNITQFHMLEETLSDVGFPIAFVRAGALIENFLASLGKAAESGVFDSSLQPVDRAFPMAAIQDMGAEVAHLLTAAPWEGRRAVELGSRVTPYDIATAMSEALGREVVVRPIAREHWNAVLGAMNLTSDQAGNWAEMQDGFNSGWIDFDVPGAESVAGITKPPRSSHRRGGPRPA